MRYRWPEIPTRQLTCQLAHGNPQQMCTAWEALGGTAQAPCCFRSIIGVRTQQVSRIRISTSAASWMRLTRRASETRLSFH
eukprot:COSAG01_NODE_397_length_17560_cov_111.258347_6_plen_81_part_00